ncbi:MAG: ARMT1-like domain-containing protein [Planctomycetota bacterium]
MRTYLECVPCFVRQTLEVARMITGDTSVHERALREVLHHAAEMDMSASPPAIGRTIHRIIRRITGVADPYVEQKKRFNAFALGLYPEFSGRIDRSGDPLSAAVHLAAAGNIVDLGAKSGLDQRQIHEALEHALTDTLDPGELAAFRDGVQKATSILYLGDNTGEIVFDRMLIERLPREKITFAVRGRPIINDALMQDAIDTGIADLVPVIDNGSDVPGTIIEECSPEFTEQFRRADMIIAKGQGNYETLSEENAPVTFLLKIKCPVIARDAGRDAGSLMLQRKR